MAEKSVVLSLKCGGTVRSWKGDRMLGAWLIDPDFFANPAESGLLSDKPVLHNHPLLGSLYACDLVPGSSGWIGIDADRRLILDAQDCLETVGGYVAAMGASKDILESPGVPDPLVHACMNGPWSSRAFTSKSEAWRRHAPLARPEDWPEALAGACVHARKQAMRTRGVPVAHDLGRAWVEIKPAPARGWRLVSGLHPLNKSPEDAARFRRLIHRLRTQGWGWSETLWPAWREYAQENRRVDPDTLDAIQAQAACHRLDRALPAAAPKAGKTKHPRF